jgi:hypothetical protein
VKTGRIFQKQVYKTNPQYESLRFGFTNPDSRVRQPGFVNHDTKRIFLESGFVPTIRNESMDSRNESMFLRISYTIPASLGATQVGEFVIVFGIVFFFLLNFFFLGIVFFRNCFCAKSNEYSCTHSFSPQEKNF